MDSTKKKKRKKGKFKWVDELVDRKTHCGTDCGVSFKAEGHTTELSF